MKKISLLIIVLLLAFSSTALSIEISDSGISARITALAGATTALESDASNGIFGNPASLAQINTAEVVNMYTNLSNDVDYALLGFVLPAKYGIFGLGYSGYSTSITGTTLDSNGRVAASLPYNFYNIIYTLSYGNMFNKDAAYGIRVNSYSSGTHVQSSEVIGGGMNLDIGLIGTLNELTKYGVQASNLLSMSPMNWSNGAKETRPLKLDIGIARQVGLASLFGNYELQENDASRLAVAVEYLLSESLALRLGANHAFIPNDNYETNITGGIGLNFFSFSLDYAYVHSAMVSHNSRQLVSISLKFPGSETASPATAVQTEKKAAMPLEVQAVMPVSTEVVLDMPKPIEYFVKPGDCLSKISEEYLGDWLLYPRIARDNNIDNPDEIYEGQKIIINK